MARAEAVKKLTSVNLVDPETIHAERPKTGRRGNKVRVIGRPPPTSKVVNNFIPGSIPSQTATFTKRLRNGSFDELPHKRGVWVAKCGVKNCLCWVTAKTGNGAADGFIKANWKYVVGSGWVCKRHQA